MVYKKQHRQQFPYSSGWGTSGGKREVKEAAAGVAGRTETAGVDGQCEVTGVSQVSTSSVVEHFEVAYGTNIS